MLKPLLGLILLAGLPALASPQDAVEKAILPDGLKIEIFVEEMPRARSLAVADDGTLAVGTTAGSVHLLRDADGDGVPEVRLEISGRNNPNGVAWQGKDLYIAETTRVIKISNAYARLQGGGQVKVEEVASGFVNSTHHGNRVIDFAPSGELFVALGVPCNICEPPEEELTGTIRAYNLAQNTSVTYAYGLRNSVGFDWHPVTGELWATDNGRDWLGDDLPHDELNRIAAAGTHLGYPYCHQGDLADSKFGDERDCSEFVPPALNLGPHVASLGIHFIAADPAAVASDSALIALHGSWNRSDPIGYEVIRVRFDASGERAVFFQTFIGGWLDNGKGIARPVDVASLPDGSVLVSDDLNGAIYRISKIAAQ